MSGQWVVDRIGTPATIRELADNHLQAAQRAEELRRSGIRCVVAWFIPDWEPIKPRTKEEP